MAASIRASNPTTIAAAASSASTSPRGKFETVYDACDGRKLCGPNDIVFDRSGGFWFTDHGKTRPRERDRTGVFYARADGSRITEAIFPLEGPNGIGLSRDEDELYVAETVPGRLWAYPDHGTGAGKLASDACCKASAASTCTTRWPSTPPATSASRH